MKGPAVLERLRQRLNAGSGPANDAALLLEALLEAAVPGLVVVVALIYSTLLTDMLVAKTAAIHIAVPLLVAVWLVRAAVLGRLRLELPPFLVPMGLYVAVSLVSLALALNRGQAAEQLALQIWFFLFFIVVLHHFRDPAAAAGVMWTTVLTGLAVACLGILQYNGVHLLPLPAAVGDLPVSTLGNPNFVAHYLEIIIPLALAMLFIRRRAWERALLVLVVAAASIHLLLSQSRAGWLAVGVGIGGWVFLRYGLRLPWRRLAVGALVALLATPALGTVAKGVYLGSDRTLYDGAEALGGRVAARFVSSFDRGNFSVAQRLLIWGDSVDLVADQPWLGVGPGNYQLALPAYRTDQRHAAWRELMGQRRNVAYHAHNEFIEYWAESGIVGAAAMVWLFGALLYLGVRGARDERPSVRAVSLGCLAGILATLVHSLFSFNLQDPTSATHFWLLAGLLVSVNIGAAAPRIVEFAPGRAGRWGLSLAGVALVLGGGWLGWSILAGDLFYFDGQQKYRVLNQPNRAVLALRQAEKHRPWEFRYPHTLGLVSLAAGRHDEAEQALRRSDGLHPNNAPALRLWGRSLVLLNRPAEALGPLQRAVALDPYHAEGLSWLGRVRTGLKDYDGAVAALERAVALEATAERYFRLGLARGLGGDLAGGIEVLQKAVTLEPERGEARGYLGAFLLGQGQAAAAAPLLSEAAAADPPNALQWRLYLARALMAQGRSGAAAGQLRVLQEAAPQNAQVRALAAELASIPKK